MDENLFTVIYGLAHRSAGFDRLIVFSASWLPWLIGLLVIVITMALASRDRIPPRAGFIISIPIVAWLIAHVLKIFLAWPRPVLVLNDVAPLFVAGGAAFPSGHATLFFTLGFALHPFHPRLAAVVSGAAIIIGLARVAAGVHWPSDILGGFLLAGVVTLISWTMVKIRRPSKDGRRVV